MSPADPHADLDALARALRGHVEVLAGDVGERRLGRPGALDAAAAYVDGAVRGLRGRAASQEFSVRGRTVRNIELEFPGGRRAREVVVVGAHYDSVPGCPAANDNGSGVAAVLEMARALSGKSFGRTLRLVFFVNEEPPYFRTDAMGSLVYARRCREQGNDVVAMLSVETVGCYADAPGSQTYPLPGAYTRLARLPDAGNFLAFVSDLRSWRQVRRWRSLFRSHSGNFPSRWVAAPARLTGVGWSDHWSFWQAGYRAAMATDTAPFRYPHYHRPTDTPEKLDYARLARVVAGLTGAAAELAHAAVTRVVRPPS